MALFLVLLTIVAGPGIGFAAEWRNWGAAPYATSFAEACRKAPQAIAQLDVPEPVKRQWIAQLGDNCSGGETVYLTPDMRLRQMHSGGAKPHVMNDVPVAAIPVRRSPEGRAQREVYQSAKALMWKAEWQGKVYYLYLPLVCFNWAWRDEDDDCVEVPFNADVGGKVRWGVATNSGPLPPSVCNAQKQGDGPWVAWYGECDECVPNYGYISRVMGGSATVPHRYLYSVEKGPQVLRFSREIWSRMVYICLETAAGVQTCSVNIPPGDDEGEWQGRRVVPIADRLWQVDDGNCPE